MCGIAGLIHRKKTGDIGTEMTKMLQSLKHRGPDSTGFALYGKPKGDELVLRFKVAEQEDMAKGFDIHQQVKDRRAEVDRRLKELGAKILKEEEATEYAFRYRIEYDGDRRKLADYIEDIDGAEILSIGLGLELIKDLGDASARVRAVSSRRASTARHAIGHTRMATESDVDIRSAHPYWAYPFADVSVVHNGQLTNYWKGRRALEHRGHRFMSNCDSELIAVYLADKMQQGAELEGRDEGLDRRAGRRLHLSGGDVRQPRHGQGRDGRQADGALRKQRVHRAGLRRGGHPQRLPAGDRHLRSL